MNKTCKVCGVSKPLEDFPKMTHNPGKVYFQNRCKKCKVAHYTNLLRNDPKRRERRALLWRKRKAKDPKKFLEYCRRYRKRHPESRQRDRQVRDPFKARCRTALMNAVAAGKVVKPKQCQECGWTGRIHGHHNDYNKPLDVEWLCAICHGKRHRKY